jgi:hypothetical protein
VDEAEEAATPALIGFPGGPTDHPEVQRGHPREVDPDVVLVELDEVKVHAQAHTGREGVLAFTGLVMIAGRRWHLTAASVRELAYQMGDVPDGRGGGASHALRGDPGPDRSAAARPRDGLRDRVGEV